MPSCLRRTARTVARTSIGCASAGGGGLTWASTASLSRKPSCCLSFRVMCRYPRRKRSACRTVLSESRDTSTAWAQANRDGGTASGAGWPAGTASGPGCADRCHQRLRIAHLRRAVPLLLAGPGTREELRRQAYPHGIRIDLSHPSHRLARRAQDQLAAQFPRVPVGRSGWLGVTSPVSQGQRL